ncbi:hypothetical protein, partial [Enterobacter hormaechei]|uniref:hypothetical protein n=1 Tax=Enterobacter hormaechei TaxID=158836 RepID=UPI00203B40E9
PRMANRGRTLSDAAQSGDKSVGIGGCVALGLGIGRIVLRVQGTEIRFVHGNAPYRTEGNATDGGGGTVRGSKTGMM